MNKKYFIMIYFDKYIIIIYIIKNIFMKKLCVFSMLYYVIYYEL